MSLNVYIRTSTPFVLRLSLYLLLFLASVAGVKHLHGFIPDDAFINYRYALNLAEGHGWTYNVGSSTSNAATSPLYVLLLAFLYIIHSNMQFNANLLFALSMAGCAALTFEAFSRLKDNLTGLIASLLILSSPWLLSTRGMESAVFLLLMAASSYLYVIELQGVTGVALGLLTLARGEGVLFAITLAVTWGVLRQRIPFRMIAAVILTVIPWGVYAQLNFGQVLPNTLQAKIAQCASGFWGKGPLFLQGFYRMPKLFAFDTWAIVAGLLALLGSASLMVSRRHWVLLLPVCLYAVGFSLVYGVILKVPAYHWYYISPVYASLLLAAVGTVHLFRAGWRKRDVLSLTIGGLGLAGCVGFGIAQTPKGFGPIHYVTIANWLRNNTPRSKTVAATEIGMIGWYSERPIIDYVGLLSKESASALSRGDLTWWISYYSPDYWVVHDPPWSFETPAMSQPWFRIAFRPVYQTQGLVIFKAIIPILKAQEAVDSSNVRFVANSIRQLTKNGIKVNRSPHVEGMFKTLLWIYILRPDLQNAFGGPEKLNLSALIEWAAGPGINIDDAKKALSFYSDALKLLSKETMRFGPVYVDLDLADKPQTE